MAKKRLVPKAPSLADLPVEVSAGLAVIAGPVGPGTTLAFVDAFGDGVVDQGVDAAVEAVGLEDFVSHGGTCL